MTAPHPVLGLRDKLERVSRTACVTERMYRQSAGAALAKALEQSQRIVDARVGHRPRAGTFYYITYEVVVDDDSDGGPGRPVWTPAGDAAAGVVLPGMLRRSGEGEAA